MSEGKKQIYFLYIVKLKKITYFADDYLQSYSSLLLLCYLNSLHFFGALMAHHHAFNLLLIHDSGLHPFDLAHYLCCGLTQPFR